ncbi:MAG: hypothetical protein ACOC4C_04645 [Fibrobacterota bacterium]
MKTMILIGSLILSTFLPLRADMRVQEIRKTEEHTMMGRTVPAKEESVTTWISQQTIRSKGAENDILIRSDDGAIFVIDHKKKEYRKMPDQMYTDSMKKQMEELPPGMADKMKQMMEMKVTIQPTNETATVNGWRSRKYTQTIETEMGTTVTQLWATKQVDIAPELMASFMTAFYKSGPMAQISGNMLSEMEKIDGFVVKSSTTTTIMGTQIESSSEVVDVKENAQPPEGIYELPQDYQQGEWK